MPFCTLPLADLAAAVLGRQMREASGGRQHDSFEDADVALALVLHEVAAGPLGEIEPPAIKVGGGVGVGARWPVWLAARRPPDPHPNHSYQFPPQPLASSAPIPTTPGPALQVSKEQLRRLMVHSIPPGVTAAQLQHAFEAAGRPYQSLDGEPAQRKLQARLLAAACRRRLLVLAAACCCCYCLLQAAVRAYAAGEQAAQSAASAPARAACRQHSSTPPGCTQPPTTTHQHRRTGGV